MDNAPGNTLDPNEMVDVRFTGEFARDLIGRDGQFLQTLRNGDTFSMKREQAEVDIHVEIINVDVPAPLTIKPPLVPDKPKADDKPAE